MATPTPPPHTPVVYIKGGGSKNFSKKCKELLVGCNLNPDWCGSYSEVREKIKSAQEEMAEYDKAVADAQSTQGITPPDAATQYLANCDAGHLVRDSNFRESGGRGDICANLVDGFLTSSAPCVPMEGPAGHKWCPQSHSVHGRYTVQENNDAANAATNPGHRTDPGPYEASDREADEAARCDEFLKDHKKTMEDNERNNQLAAQADQPDVDASQAHDGRDAIEATVPKDPDDVDGGAVTGDSAGECLNNFKKKQLEQMEADFDAKEAEYKAQSDLYEKQIKARAGDELADNATKAECLEYAKSKPELGWHATRLENAENNSACCQDQKSRMGTSGARTTGRAA